MSKLMIVFMLFISGALYDPPRVLNHLGPYVLSVGLAHQDRAGPLIARKSRSARLKPAGSSRLEMCPAPASST